MLTRWWIFLFGLLSYVAALTVFVGLIAFCAGTFAVRRHAAASGPGLWGALAVDACLVLVFGLQHSVMARPAVKRLLMRLVPPEAERSLFVLLASAALALLLWQWRPLPGSLWHAATGWPHVLLTALFAAGWLGVFACTFLVGHFDLLGLRQVTLQLRGAPYTPLPFVESGAYGAVRHPLMLAFLVAFWAAPVMTWGHVVLALGMSGYILVGLAFEERDLEHAFGARYRGYRARVPMLVPWRPAATRATRAAANARPARDESGRS